MNKKIRTIITGATGMVGEGVLHVSLQHPDVEKVLVINRKPCGVTHPKLIEIIHDDFYNLSSIENKLSGYNACFFCLGISSIGILKEEYFKITYTLTMHLAETLSKVNDDMTFCYISGAGTGANSRQNWAKTKAKTEHDLQKLPLTKVFSLRPGFIKLIKGLQHTHSFYKYIMWLFPAGCALFPNGFCTMEELALCMIHLAQRGYEKNILEGKDIIAAAKIGS
ncbi:MAG: epimerase [Bacteroidota bacterium]|nr:epimerase [Bacteroidota bacterium]